MLGRSLQVHDVTEFQTAPSSASGPRKVDTGTQVEKQKRRGRKTKEEMLALERLQQEQEDQNVAVDSNGKVIRGRKKKDADDEDESANFSDSDEDWVETISSYSTRSRRKRRPPKELRDNYYLGRKKVRREPQRRDKVDMSYRCPTRGCGLKFPDRQTMEVHQAYHVESVTQGTCLFK